MGSDFEIGIYWCQIKVLCWYQSGFVLFLVSGPIKLIWTQMVEILDQPRYQLDHEGTLLYKF